MSLREIFNLIIDYDLTGIINIVLAIILIIVMVGAVIWLVFQILELKDEYKEKPIASSIKIVFFTAALLAILFSTYVLIFIVPK